MIKTFSEKEIDLYTQLQQEVILNLRDGTYQFPELYKDISQHFSRLYRKVLQIDHTSYDVNRTELLEHQIKTLHRDISRVTIDWAGGDITVKTYIWIRTSVGDIVWNISHFWDIIQWEHLSLQVDHIRSSVQQFLHNTYDSQFCESIVNLDRKIDLFWSAYGSDISLHACARLWIDPKRFGLSDFKEYFLELWFHEGDTMSVMDFATHCSPVRAYDIFQQWQDSQGIAMPKINRSGDFVFKQSHVQELLFGEY